MSEEFDENLTVFDFIKTEEDRYKAETPVSISNGYEWSMAKHLKLSTLYPLSQYERGNSDNKPFNQIIQPILNLQHRAEGFDVKDVILYVNSRKNNHKSFIIKKYHEKYVRENDIDEIIDASVESYCDMGGTLMKNAGELPESVPLQRLAFCDQTDILSGPICEKHNYAPDELLEMADKHWGDEKYGADMSIDDLILLSKTYKKVTDKETKTPGKYIEVYELHGVLPEAWLKGEGGKFIRQLQIVSFYTNKDGNKQFVKLYAGKEEEQIYFLEKRTPRVYGRALGVGGAEELFEPQVWANYNSIRMKDMLDAASKIILQTADGKIAKRQNIKGLKNLSILQHDDGKPLTQVPTIPANFRLFENAVREWEERAKTIGAANESIMGESPASGTPFKLQELVTAEAHSLHEYRKGKIAKFWEKIYRKCIIPKIVAEINQGQEFLSELDLDELQDIAQKIAKNQAHNILKEKVLNGETIEQGEKEALEEKIKQDFMAGGSKKFIQAVKDELKDAPVDIEINISGKQKNLSAMTDKLVNVLRFMFSTWNAQTQSFAVFDDSRMMDLFNQIIESSGLSPINATQITKSAQPIAPAQTQPLANITAEPKAGLTALTNE